MVKLNRLHWHITDTNSFPLVIASRPFLHQYGAYSPKEIYTSENVKDVSSAFEYFAGNQMFGGVFHPI